MVAILGPRWSAVTVDCVDPHRLGTFWATLLGLTASEPLPGWIRLCDDRGAAPVINFQPVTEPKSGKTRIHLDVTVDDIDDAAGVVERLGGRSLEQRHDYDEGVVMVMADPEDNEFCIVQYFP